MSSVYLVLGATGRTGQHFVSLALQQGHTVRALVRNPNKLTTRGPKLETYQGSITGQLDLDGLLKGVDAVVAMLGDAAEQRASKVNTGLVTRLIPAMRRQGVRRFLYQAGGFTRPYHQQLPLSSWLLRNTIARWGGLIGQHEDNEAVIEYLVEEAQDIDWVVHRASILSDGPSKGILKRSGTRLSVATFSDCAAYNHHLLADPAAKHTCDLSYYASKTWAPRANYRGRFGMENNEAAWLVEQKRPLEIGPAPLREPGNDEIVVRNYAIAINPADWIVQCAPRMICSWMKLPSILGSDVAGEVVAVGSEVTRFRIGDRVLGHAIGLDKLRNSTADTGFQRFTVLLERMASPIPDALPYEDACVLPLGLSTAACGLFQKDQLALQHPQQKTTATGKTLLVWGGSTSVGSNAIQLGKAAGYEVFATASAKNFAYLRELGAAGVFDYKDEGIVSRLIEALQGKTLAGAISIGVGSADLCLQVVGASRGNKAVAIASGPLQFQRIATGSPVPVEMLRQSPAFLRFGAHMLRSRMRGVRTSFIWGSSLMHNEVGSLIYRDFLPQALAEWHYRAWPPPLLAGRGLAAIQPAMELLRNGVSAAKVVVSLP